MHGEYKTAAHKQRNILLRAAKASVDLQSEMNPILAIPHLGYASIKNTC